ncbi:hypothetical protein EDD22DRAFT_961425 [Suillus occidentalis]|nr:hypothetical protein EDD22DRAFT_961425 [Suillus occidentalis]
MADIISLTLPLLPVTSHRRHPLPLPPGTAYQHYPPLTSHINKVSVLQASSIEGTAHQRYPPPQRHVFSLRCTATLQSSPRAT